MTLPPRLLSLAMRHDGVLTAADFRAFGLSRAAVHRMVAAGELIGVTRGVHRLAAHPLTARTRLRTTVLCVGMQPILSGVCAAW
ncbi:type IV toxin-antitoxin system AbiEi family antitoxin domain-containing protein [Gordonia polyisoprenivorans]